MHTHTNTHSQSAEGEAVQSAEGSMRQSAEGEMGQSAKWDSLVKWDSQWRVRQNSQYREGIFSIK